MHAVAVAKGRFPSILPTGGEVHDCVVAEQLIEETKAADEFLGDKAYDSTELREQLEERGTTAVIPNRSNRKRPFRFNKKSYKRRQRIENAICRFKGFRRITIRYDKLAQNFLARVCLVAAVVWWIL
jgi:IS5 family transposase